MSDLQTNVGIKVVNQASEPLAQINKDMQQLTQTVQKAGSDTSVSTAFSKMGAGAQSASKDIGFLKEGMSGFVSGITPMQIGAAAIGAALAALAKSSIAAAQDLQTVGTMAKIVFGDDFIAMRGKIEGLSESLGRNGSEIMKFSTSVMTIAQGLGVSKKAAEDMGIGLSELAVNFGKAFNVSDDSAMEALKMGIEGNARALRQFNIVMNDATLQEYLNAEGIKMQYSQLDEASQATVRYNFLMDKTAEIQAAGIANTGSLADETKRLGAEWNDLKEAMGTEFLPAVTEAVHLLVGSLHLLSGAMWEVRQAIKMASMGQIDANAALEYNTDLTQQNIAFQEAHGIGLGKLSGEMATLAKHGKLTSDGLHLSSAAMGQMAGEAKKLSKEMTDLNDNFSKTYDELGQKSKQAEMNHNSAVESIKTKQGELYARLNELRIAASNTATAFADIGVKFKQTMADLNTDSITSVGAQLQKIKDISNELQKAGGQQGALSTDQIVGRIANRTDKTSLTLSAEDARGLSQSQEDQVNKTMQLQREQKAYTEYLVKALGLNKDLANSISAGSPDYVKNAEKLVAGDPNLSKGIALAGQTDFAKTQAQILKRAGEAQTGMDQATEKNTQEKEKNDREQAQVKTQLDALEKKRKAVEYAYQMERAEIGYTKVALDAFHTQYLTQMQDMAKVTQETVDNVKKQLDLLRQALTQAQTDAAYAAQATSNASAKGASRAKFADGGVVQRRAGGLDATIGEGLYNEAVVPLPDGTKIPVQLQGGGGRSGDVNITIQSMTVEKTADVDEVMKTIARQVTLQKIGSSSL